MQQGRNAVKIQRTLAQPIHPHSSLHVSYTLLLLSGMNFLVKLFSVLRFSSPSDVFSFPLLHPTIFADMFPCQL